MSVNLPILQLMKPRWRKVVRDLWDNKARTVLVVLAIAVGVFAFGGVFTTREVFLKEMNAGFTATNPATLIISTSDFSEGLVRTVRSYPEVLDAQPSTTFNVRVHVESPLPGVPEWLNMTINSVQDFEDIRINQIAPELGSYPPGRREILLERRSFPLLGVDTGDSVLIELPDGTQRELTVVGTVHDFSALPANIIPQPTAYATLATLELLGHPGTFNTLNVITTPEYNTLAELELVGDDIGERLENAGYFVGFVQAQEPGKHWSNDVVNGFVTALGIVGLLALGLSGFLVVNTLSAILAQQKRQIGMMKAIGARFEQVLAIYLAMASTFGGLSLFVALPMGVLLAWLLTRSLAYFVNVNIDNFYLPLWVLGLQFVMALLTPLIAALIPLYMGTRVTVREAVSDYGIQGVARKGPIDHLLGAIRGLPRPTMLSLRNTFRRKGRLTLTLATLVTAGAIFMSILNVRGSLLIEVNQIMQLFNFDFMMFLGGAYPIARIEREASRIEGIEKVENWGFAQASRVRDDDVEPASFIIFAPPTDTTFVIPTLLEGRWIEPGDTNVIVVSSQLVRDDPAFAVGNTVLLDFGDIERRMEVVGMINLVGPPFTYASYDYITRLQGAPGQSFAVFVETGSDQNPVINTVMRSLEERFKDSGVTVGGTQSIQEMIGSTVEQVDYFVYIMLIMAVLLASVGGLGLASTMSLNVLERTREIGVMRAVGAADGQVLLVVLAEGLLIGFISWVLATALSLPVTYGFDAVVGNSFFERPLIFTILPASIMIWLFIVLVISTLASLLPAVRASRVSVRESLAYE